MARDAAKPRRAGRSERALDKPLEYNLAERRSWAWARVARIAMLGSTGKIKATAAAGYAVGLRALEKFIDRTDPVPKDDGGTRAPTVVNIAIVTPARGDDRALPRPARDGVAIRVSRAPGKRS